MIIMFIVVKIRDYMPNGIFIVDIILKNIMYDVFIVSDVAVFVNYQTKTKN